MIEKLVDKDKYLEDDSKLVISRLKDLEESRQLLSVCFGSDNDGYLTCIHSIDDKNKLIVIDCSQDDGLNNKLLKAECVLFHGKLNGISLYFYGLKAKKQFHDNQDVFVIPLPDSIIWVQRRKFHRVRMPDANSECFLELSADEIVKNSGMSAMNEMPILAKFKIGNISLSGFAFWNDRPEFSKGIKAGVQYKKALLRLQVQPVCEARIDFNVVSVTSVGNKHKSGRELIRCEFSKMPPEFMSYLEKFIRFVEIEHIKQRTQR